MTVKNDADNSFPYIILLVLILITGFFLRVYNLDGKTFWIDEIRTIQHAQEPLPKILFFTKLHLYPESNIWRHVHPPLHYLAARFWLLFGTSDFFLRFPAVLLGVLSIFFLYLLGSTLVNRSIGILSAALLSVNYLHVIYSRTVRFQPYLVLFTILSLFFLIRAIQSKKGKDWFLFTLVSVLNLYTNFFAVFVLGIEIIYIACSFFIHKTARSKKAFFSVCSIFLITLPVFMKIVTLLLYNIQHGVSPAGTGIGKMKVCFDVMKILTVNQAFYSWMYMFFTIIGLTWFLIKKRLEGVVFLLWIGIPISIFFVLRVTHTLKPRYFIFILPIVLLLVATGIYFSLRAFLQFLRRKHLAQSVYWELFFMSFFIVFFGIVSVAQVLPFLRERAQRDYTRMAEFITESIPAESYAIVAFHGTYVRLERYLPQDVQEKMVESLDQYPNSPKVLFVSFYGAAYDQIISLYPDYRVDDALITDKKGICGVIRLKKSLPVLIKDVTVLEQNKHSEKSLEISAKIHNTNTDFARIIPIQVTLEDGATGHVLDSALHCFLSRPGEKQDFRVLFPFKDPSLNTTVDVSLLRDYFIFNPFDSHFYSTCGKKEYNRISFFGMQTSVRKAEKKQGYLVYGPYVDIQKGSYVLTAIVSVTHADKEHILGTIEISADGGENIIISKDMYFGDFYKEGVPMLFSLPFSLSEKKNLEFRIKYAGFSDMNSEGFVVFKMNDPNYIAEKLLKKKLVN